MSEKKKLDILERSVHWYVYSSLALAPLGLWQLLKWIHKILVLLSQHIKIV